MGRAVGWGRLVVAGLLFVLATAGCASSIGAQSSSSLVRGRPTTPPADYSPKMNQALQTLSSSLDKLAALLGNPRYFDETWKSEAVDLATAVELGYRKLDELTPSQTNREQHAAVVTAVQDCQTLTVYVFQGINNLDKGPFDEVKQRVDSCRSKLRSAAGGSIGEQGQPASAETVRKEIRGRVKRDANLRGGPSTQNPVVATAALSDTITIVGRSEKADWLQVTTAKGQNAWIAAFLVQADGDLASIPVINQPTNQANP